MLSYAICGCNCATTNKHKSITMQILQSWNEANVGTKTTWWKSTSAISLATYAFS
jgi:hypothetical protein